MNIKRTNIENEIEIANKKLEGLKEDCSNLEDDIAELEKLNSFNKGEIEKLREQNSKLELELKEKED